MLAVLFQGCLSSYGPYKVTRSLYLNKKMLKFIVDNGVPYRSLRLRGGGELHYWRSDRGPFSGFSLAEYDSMDYCEIALRTDAQRYIREITVIEPGHLCNSVLK
jgi:hypothetical protein